MKCKILIVAALLQFVSLNFSIAGEKSCAQLFMVKAIDLELKNFLDAYGFVDLTSPNKYGSYPMKKAVSDREYRVVKLLRESGIDINEQDSEGWTLLMRFAHNDALNVVKFLLENGARTDIRNKKGKTALDVAKGWSFYEIQEHIKK